MWWTVVVVLYAISSVSAADPTVTLDHGGRLQGRRLMVDGKAVDQFLGVPYAKPPVGELRFKKPQSADSWSGVKVVNKYHSKACVQAGNFLDPSTTYAGSEDCLYMDITVPGGVDNSSQKPVMIWIHGGGYVVGMGMTYVGVPLAIHGDVIVVTINYRLGVFGFLSESSSTGNFGLWDQKAAMSWVKENIDRFGGNPLSITISGQSAGSGSVAAQIMGQHNDGLFQRAISESGSMYQPWNWYLSDKTKGFVRNHLTNELNCGVGVSLYACLRDKTLDEIWNSASRLTMQNLWQPTPDNDFFAPDIVNETYDLSRRFDLMVGSTGQEGAGLIPYLILTYLTPKNLTAESNLSRDVLMELLEDQCTINVGYDSKELCADYVYQTYGLDQTQDGRQALIRISFFFGDLYSNADIFRLLMRHTNKNTKTFGYRFNDYVRLPGGKDFFGVPDWGKLSASHGDELVFLFGVPFMTDDMLQSLAGNENDPMAQLINTTRQHFTDEQKNLSRSVMTMWTNFVRSGDPNIPAIASEIPQWPQFDTNGQKLLEIGRPSTVMDIPDKERLNKMLDVVFPVRRRHAENDKMEPRGDCPIQVTSTPKTFNSASDMSKSSSYVYAILLCIFYYFCHI